MNAGVIFSVSITSKIKFTKSYIPNINLEKIGWVLVESETNLFLILNPFF